MRFLLKFENTFLNYRLDFNKVLVVFADCINIIVIMQYRNVFMARIIENEVGRRMIKMSVDDIICVVREYQRVVSNPDSYDEIRELLSNECMYLPEEI